MEKFHSLIHCLLWIYKTSYLLKKQNKYIKNIIKYKSMCDDKKKQNKMTIGKQLPFERMENRVLYAQSRSSFTLKFTLSNNSSIKSSSSSFFIPFSSGDIIIDRIWLLFQGCLVAIPRFPVYPVLSGNRKQEVNL